MTSQEADKAGWRRFHEVEFTWPPGHKLYRSSAPNYAGGDSTQKLDDKALAFLIDKTDIDGIISFCSRPYTYEEQKRLSQASRPIDYKWLRVMDFHTATLDQLKEAHAFFLEHRSTLVHCGYGHGRTGTGVTALELLTIGGNSLKPLASTWRGANHVETRGQVSILAQQRNRLLPRVTGDPDAFRGTFAIISLDTGYFLTVGKDKVTTHSPETVSGEDISSIGQAYQWVITRHSNTGDYILSNKLTPTNFTVTKSTDTLVWNGTEKDGNVFFTIKDDSNDHSGWYIISPQTKPHLAISIETPSNYQLRSPNDKKDITPQLKSKDEAGVSSRWIFVQVDTL